MAKECRVVALLAALLCCALATLIPRGAAAAPSGACAGANLYPDAADRPTVASATLCLINRIRRAAHLRALVANRPLAAVAAAQLSSMVHHDYFADVRPSGQTPMSLVAATSYRAHATSFSVGENLAWATGRGITPARIVAEWMASPPHRAVILDGEFRDAGVAVTAAVPSFLIPDEQGATYAIEFGARSF